MGFIDCSFICSTIAVCSYPGLTHAFVVCNTQVRGMGFVFTLSNNQFIVKIFVHLIFVAFYAGQLINCLHNRSMANTTYIGLFKPQISDTHNNVQLPKYLDLRYINTALHVLQNSSSSHNVRTGIVWYMLSFIPRRREGGERASGTHCLRICIIIAKAMR